MTPRGCSGSLERTVGAQACPFDELRVPSWSRDCAHSGGRDKLAPLRMRRRIQVNPIFLTDSGGFPHARGASGRGGGADISYRANSSDPCLRNAICMKMRDTFPWPGGAARFLRGSVFLVVLVLGSEATPRAGPPLLRAGPLLPQSTRPRPENDGSSPYLRVIAPPPLRFAQNPPPDLSTRPAPTAPPLPAVMEDIAASNAASARYVAPSRGSDGTGADQRQTTPAEANPTAPVKAPGKKETPALLPDDTQHEVRPEEILPFFQFPNSGGTTIIVAPGPTSPESTRLPVSSAVYRER